MNKKIQIIIFIIILISGIGFYYYTENTKIRYSNEFPFMPVYKVMTVQYVEKAKESGSFGNAVYVLQKIGKEDYLKEYKNIFKRDGWKISQEKENYFRAEKESHNVAIAFNKTKDGINVLVWAK